VEPFKLDIKHLGRTLDLIKQQENLANEELTLSTIPNTPIVLVITKGNKFDNFNIPKMQNLGQQERD